MDRKNNMDTSKNDFDHIKWKNQFEIASKKGDGFRELRAEVFQNTIKIVENGGYYADGVFINIPNKLLNEKTEYFTAPDKLKANGDYQTEYSVINADCLETAEDLLESGFNPCVLNLASRQNPGEVFLAARERRKKIYSDELTCFCHYINLLLSQMNTE